MKWNYSLFSFVILFLGIQWSAFAGDTSRKPSSIGPQDLQIKQEFKGDALDIEKKMAVPHQSINRTPPNPRTEQEKVVYGVPFRR